jgi:hypothetical protein
MIGWLCGEYVPSPCDRTTHRAGGSGRVMSMTGEGLLEAPAVLVYRDRCTNKEAGGKLLVVRSRLRAMVEQ